MKFATILAAGVAAIVAAVPAGAATITYTYSSTFEGNNGGSPFSIAATFTGVGDTTDGLTLPGGFPAIRLTSFTALADGPYTISTPFVFGVNAVNGIAGFVTTDGTGGFTFTAPELVGYDGVSSLAAFATLPFFTETQFQTDRGFITLTGQSAGTFSAIVSAGAVPEPATWAMMIGGVGLVGGALRRRGAVRTSVRFA